MAVELWGEERWRRLWLRRQIALPVQAWQENANEYRWQESNQCEHPHGEAMDERCLVLLRIAMIDHRQDAAMLNSEIRVRGCFHQHATASCRQVPVPLGSLATVAES